MHSSLLKWVAGGVLFVLLATANGAGYRYGVSDQAFYVPAVNRILAPDGFPRDAALIDAQARLILTDEVLAGLAQTSGLSLATLFFVAYLLSLALIWTAVVLIGRTLYVSPWLVAALGAAVTLRHQIPRTSANSLEPYFHPRVLAFGLGALAIAAILRRRPWSAALLVAVAGLVHVTTAVWFGVVAGVALMLLDARWRRAGWIACGAAAVLAAAALIGGPARSALAPMDAGWLQAVSGKDSLLATEWPLWAWIANLGSMALLWWAYRRRVRNAGSRPEERALVWGAAGLTLVFLMTLPAVAARLALPVQLQISRIFWLIEFLAIVFLIGLVRRERAAVTLAAVLFAVSTMRAVYIMTIERPERALFAIELPASPWEDAMAWLRQRPLDAHVLADPGHAWKYGTSVRVSAGRDVFLEDVKDSAIAIYSRDVAMRYLERIAAIGDFGQLNPHTARELAAKYDLDYLVTESDFDLPVAYRNSQFRIYAVGPGDGGSGGDGVR